MSSKAASAMSDEKSEKSALVPRLRFPEFRGAGDWVEMSLGEIGEIVTGKTPSTSDDSLWNGDIQFVTPTDISEEKYQWSTQRSVAINANTKVLPLHSTMFTCIASIGKMALSVKPCITNQQINTVIPNKDYENEFVYYSLLNIVPLIKGTQANSTLPIINKTEFSKFTIPVPRVHDEQQKIADCLSSLDDLITAETHALIAIKTHKKGLMQQLFPRAGETQPRLRFPEFQDAGEWSEKPLAEVCNVLQGYGFPEVMQGRGEGKYPFCKVSDISRAVAEKGGRLDEATNYVGDDDLLQLRARLIPEGATVFAKIGEALRLNRRAYVQKECLIDNNATGLKAIDGVADDYFVYLLSQLIDLNKHCGGAVPSVNKTTLEEIEVVVPGLDEQKRIAESLSSLDDVITAQSQKIDALKTHKKGLMQQLFPVLNGASA